MRLTSSIMREAELRLSHDLNIFVCCAIMHVTCTEDGAMFWASGLEEQVHRLLRRDGYNIDGTWDDRFITYRSSADKRVERIKWCRKIADELEAQEQANAAPQTR